MSTKTKVVKNFYTDITSCKDFKVDTRDLCIISRDGKFGVAEKHRNGKLTFLVDCEYDYIDTFCSEKGFTNMVSVSLNGKHGLYAFKFTESSKSTKICCEKITTCEYDNIYFPFGNDVAVLEKCNNSVRYYNIVSRKLSPLYQGYNFDEMGEIYYFYTDKVQRCIDYNTDNVIYSCPAEETVSAEKIWRELYVLTHYDFDNLPIEQNINDLLFYNRNLMTSYLIENVECLHITRYDYDKWGVNHIVTFLKEGQKHIIATDDSQWDFDEIRKIAKEIDYT